jgi:hypothetical protein
VRINRVAADNIRTQGPQRRDWYRRHSPLHLRAVAHLVEDVLAVRGAGAPGAAVVLGAGACTELPLERLARACTSVLLVDVDVPGMVRAREELPPALRPRVNLVAADLTGGVSAALDAELRAQPWADLVHLGGPSGTAPLDAAAACLERCPVPDPAVIAELAPRGYGLVISSLVLTQLFSLPLLDVLDALALHAPAAADLRDTHLRYRAAAMSFRRRVAQAHLSLIGALLAPNGAGLLMTDITGQLVAPQSGPHAGQSGRDDESLPVLPAEALALPGDVAGRFALVGDVRLWRWIVSTPELGLPGRAYDAGGLVFHLLPAT